ncbi:hypothetical protein STEG23_004412, partial [Scotinomys teguina]
SLKDIDGTAASKDLNLFHKHNDSSTLVSWPSVKEDEGQTEEKGLIKMLSSSDNMKQSREHNTHIPRGGGDQEGSSVKGKEDKLKSQTDVVRFSTLVFARPYDQSCPPYSVMMSMSLCLYALKPKANIKFPVIMPPKKNPTPKKGEVIYIASLS